MKLNPIFIDIAKRYAIDYRLAEEIHMETHGQMIRHYFPLSLLFGPKRKDHERIFDAILNGVLNNDSQLQSLLRKAKIGNLVFKNKFLQWLRE